MVTVFSAQKGELLSKVFLLPFVLKFCSIYVKVTTRSMLILRTLSLFIQQKLFFTFCPLFLKLFLQEPSLFSVWFEFERCVLK